MASENLISVIVPVFNIMKYLPRCVSSICVQTHKNLEILLVDDGSTDGTGELCDKLAKTDARIRVIHKENGGSSSARNAGIREAGGEYLGFVDSDDYIAPQMYEILLAQLVASKMPIAQTGRREIAETGEELEPICIPPAKNMVCSSEDFMKELLLHKGDCSFCTKLFAKRLFAQHQFPEGFLNEDFWLLVHMLCEIKGIVCVPQRMYFVCYRMGSNTRKRSKEEFSAVYWDCVQNADMAAQLTEDFFPRLQTVSMRFGLFQRLEYLLHIPISQMQKRNAQYKKVTAYIRKHSKEAFRSPYLTKQNKIYILLLAAAPKLVRKVHKRIRKL